MAVLDAFRLDGRAAIVTGASSGLGVSFARALAEAGADVALGARRADRLEDTRRLVEETGRRAVTHRTDVSVPEDCQALVDVAMAAFGRVDVLVNNAGISAVSPLLRQDPADFRRVIDVNLNGCAWMAQAAARVMRPGSSIVNVSSVIGLKGSGAPQAPYAAAKAGLMGLTRDLAAQWTGRRGIRVNALAPGFFASELMDAFMDDVPALEARIPAGRLGDAEELAATLVFLASDAASYVTGQTLVVDGGFTIL